MRQTQAQTRIYDQTEVLVIGSVKRTEVVEPITLRNSIERRPGNMTNISVEKLTQSLRLLKDQSNVQECSLVLASLRGDSISLGSPTPRASLLRIYELRENRANRKGFVVPGGMAFVEELKHSEADSVFVLPIQGKQWSGCVFIENTACHKCLGTIGPRLDDDLKNSP